MRHAALAAILLAGCSGGAKSVDAGAMAGDTDAGADAGEQEFIALQSDLEGYADWRSIVLPDVGSGARTIYVNQLPPAGASKFPVGTILVKVTSGSPPQIDAMVKRGGGFNCDGGACGWEWMGLNGPDAGALIAWRGTAPPPGGGYQGGLADDCNLCHGLASDNDDVRLPADDAGYQAAAALRLSGSP